MHRFIIPGTPVIGEDLTLPADTSHQISRVLRLHEGDEIRLLNGEGGEWTASLTRIDPRESVAHAMSVFEGNPEPVARITLYAALIKYDRFEFMLQKATELGVSRVVPFVSAYTNARPPSDNRLIRWRRVMAEAVEQSGRKAVPELTTAMNFAPAKGIAFMAANKMTPRNKRVKPRKKDRQGFPPMASAHRRVIFGDISAETVIQAAATSNTPKWTKNHA